MKLWHSIDNYFSEKEIEKVKTLFTDALGDLQGGNIELKPLSPQDHPVVITKPEFMRRMKEMQAMQEIPDSEHEMTSLSPSGCTAQPPPRYQGMAWMHTH